MKRLAVIGAGASGLCGAKYGLENGLEVTVFEKANSIGGTWVYTDDTGKDEFGIEIHSSMYKGLYTNLPKETMGFPDYPIPEQDRSYLPAEDILQFFKSYAKHFNIYDHIKYYHYVINVEPITINDAIDSKWTVTVKDLPNNHTFTEIFDGVLVCNGHYHSPLYPNLINSEKYMGKQLHSHEYRCPDPYKDENVLVIGAGRSGLEICNDVYRVAKSVTLSHHEKFPNENLLPNIIKKGDVLRLTENGAEFINGTTDSYSVIIYCTGYKYEFPFLSEDCGITVENNFVQPLYKHCINIRYPTMALIGLPFYLCTGQMFDIQVRFFMKYFMGVKQWPTATEMLNDTEIQMKERWDTGLKKKHAHIMGALQGSYFDDLADTANIKRIKPVMTKLHTEGARRFFEDCIGFRYDIYRVIDDDNFIKIN